MKKNRLIAWLLVVCMMMSMFSTGIKVTYADGDGSTPLGYVTFSVEKFTLGQGYHTEPKKVPFYAGENGAELFAGVLGEDNFKNKGSIESGFYLASIKDTDSSAVNIPQYILNEAGEIEPKKDPQWLGEFDYTPKSGWVYAVNNILPPYGLSDYTPQDGDVIRTQFSVYGYGADLGIWEGGYIQAANKDALTAIVAEINSDSNKHGLLDHPAVKTAYDEAYTVLSNLESAQSVVDNALANLNSALADAHEPADTELPVITVDGLKDQQEVSSKDLTFQARVTDNKDISIVPEVKLNGAVIPATEQGYSVTLNSGENTISVTAVDQAGNKAEAIFKIIFKAAALSPQQQLNKNLAYILKTVVNPTFGTGSGEWSILSLARANYPVPDGYYDTYYNNVVTKVKELMPKNGDKLDKSRSTEHSRLILGLTSIGKDIHDVDGYDISRALSDYDYLKKQGNNGPIFALIAFNSHNYEIPNAEKEVVQTTKEELIKYILDKETKKGTPDAGGWALGSGAADPDMTAMALQSLAPYYNKPDYVNVTAAVDRAVDWLSRAQNKEGSYTSWGSTSSESLSQVVVALSELGINPRTDERFIKNGKSALDALLSFALPDGGFMHVKPANTGNGNAAPGRVDGMATDQGTYALVAYDRLVNGQTRLFDMNDVKIQTPDNPSGNEIPLPAGDKPQVHVPQDDRDYMIPVTAGDSHKEITIDIPAASNSKIKVNLPSNSALPNIEAVKGDVSVVIPKGTQIVSKNGSGLELISSLSLTDTTLQEKVKSVIPQGQKLDSVFKAFTLGGDKRVEFSQFVTLTFAGMKGKEAVYIQDGIPHSILKFVGDSEGLASGKAEYAYESGNDLVVRTKHFTDYIAYASSPAETPGGGNGTGPQPTKHANLSVDKLTINKGYVITDTRVDLQAGDTAWSVLKRMLDAGGIKYEYTWNEKFGSVYVQSIADDGEFDHGSGSGWMYNVNGTYPGYGASKYVLQDGDRLEWRYTTNLGADLGQNPGNGSNPGGQPPSSGGGGTGGGGAGSAGNPGGGTAVDNTNKTPATDGSKNPSTNTNNGSGDGKNPAAPDLTKVYSDTTAISSWAYEAVGKGTQYGFIQGSGGKFNPSSAITRAEFTKLLVSVLELDISGTSGSAFTDVTSKDWYAPYVNAAYKRGLITGYNHKFSPNDKINREQMAATITRALALKNAGQSVEIKDIGKVSSWARSDVQTVVRLGFMVGSGGQFKPQDQVTREMAAVVAVRAYDYKKKGTTGTTDTDQTPTDGNQTGQTAIKEVGKTIQATAAFMQKAISDPAVSSVGGEWTVFSLARSGIQVPDAYYAKYYANLEQTLKDKSGKLHNVKYTEYDRVILALTAMGRSIDNVAGYNLREPLADYDTLIKQGINGPVFALIALDSRDYEIPQVKGIKTQTTREMLIDFILNREINGGGWALGTNPAVPDPDVTAMVIQGLTPYYSANSKVKAAVDRGISWLSKAQKGDGSYASGGSTNVESIAQVIVALTGMGIDPHKDSRFVKNGHSPVEALLGFSAADGGFYHVKAGGIDNGGAKPGEVDLMATDQALYGLVAYDRFVRGLPRLYDMSDVK